MLLRRFITGFLMAVVIILGFVSEFHSLATFAGFLTAGIAVALQTVILSVAAYFFLIGRYGVRVGDRITVSGVTGDVIDIGLVRMHLLELAGTGVNLYPTGRVVVFSNSVLLQTSPSSSRYRGPPIPGMRPWSRSRRRQTGARCREARGCGEHRLCRLWKRN